MQIRELHLFTDDLIGTITFYKNILQLPVKEEENAGITFQVGETKLIFKASVNQHPTYHFAFAIPANQIQEAYEWAKDKLLILDAEPGEKIIDFDSWHAKAFYFLDNNGNILEFIARFDLPNKSFLPFKGSSFTSINEIGIVTQDVSSACKKMIVQYGLEYFYRQPPLEDFAAVGDDNGLFIVVPENRNWYPTNLHSSKSRMKVVFTSGIESEQKVMELAGEK